MHAFRRNVEIFLLKRSHFSPIHFISSKKKMSIHSHRKFNISIRPFSRKWQKRKYKKNPLVMVCPFGLNGAHFPLCDHIQYITYTHITHLLSKFLFHFALIENTLMYFPIVLLFFHLVYIFSSMLCDSFASIARYTRSLHLYLCSRCLCFVSHSTVSCLNWRWCWWCSWFYPSLVWVAYFVISSNRTHTHSIHNGKK